jgi:hypothetical protein
LAVDGYDEVQASWSGPHFSVSLGESARVITDLTATPLIFQKASGLPHDVDIVVMKPAQLYRQLAELPVYVAASFWGPRGTYILNLFAIVANSLNQSPLLALRVITSVRDHANNCKRTVVKTISLPIGEEDPVVTSQEQAESVIASTVSRSGTRIAILKESKEGNKTKRQVEIWRGSTAEAILDVTTKHGEFYGDGMAFL